MRSHDSTVMRRKGGSVRKGLALAAFAILVSVALAYPMISTPAGAAAIAPVIMNVGTVLVPDTFNPFSMTTGFSYMIAWLTWERLTGSDPRTLGVIPMLAQSWDTSADGKIWTFHLANNSVWHDDVPVTAEDVNFTFNLIMDNPSQCALYASYVQNITRVVALDSYTVRFETDVPKATMLTMYVPILPKHLWSAVPMKQLANVDMWNTKYFPNGPVGSGPMILKSYERTLGEIRMLKWPKFHTNTINVDEVLYKIFTTEDAMMNSLYSGSIDLAMYVPQNLWDKTLTDYPDIAGQVASQMDLHQLGFNCAPLSIRFGTDGAGHPLFPKASTNTETVNKSVRQAVAMATNKTQIVTEILKNLADKGDSVVPPMIPFWHYYVPENEEWKFNLAMANATLEAAGYRDTDSDGVRENVTSGAKLSFSFYYINGITADMLAAQKISNWLHQIGINAPASGVQESVLYNLWVGMQYDMFIWNWQPDIDPSFILSVLTSNEIPDDSHDMAAWSDSFYSNPVYDQMFIQQQNTVNITDRQSIVHEMQRMVYRDSPYVVLWYPHGLFAYRTDRFTNYPDFKAKPGATPDTMWYYFQVVPVGANAPPTADAGLDMSVYLDETVSFTGSATDANDPVSSLTWSWAFEEPDHTIITRTGRTVSYTFNNLGSVNVTLTVTDPGGLFGTDRSVVTVQPVPANVGWLVGQVNSSEGGPVVGARVDTGVMNRSTDIQGFFNLTLLAGTYAVNVSATGYANATASATITAQSKTWLNLTLNATTWSLTVHIRDATNHESIAGATINLLQANVSIATMQTNATGYQEILNIPFGTYSVKASKTGYENNETELAVSTPGTQTLEIELTPETGGGGGGGLSTAVTAGIAAALILVVVGIAALALMKRKKSGQPPEPVEPPEAP